MTMKYNDSSRYISERRDDVRQSLLDNPTLLKASGVATIAGAAVSGANAAVLVFLVLILTVVIGSMTLLDGDRLGYPLKPFIYTGVSVMTLFALLMLLKLIMPEQLNKLGIYAPLLAFNSLVLCRCRVDAPMLIGGQAVADALGLTAMFAMVALPVGMLREVLGSGEILGIDLGFSGNSAFLRPFAGFILAGFILAMVRSIMRRMEEKGGEAK